MNSSLVIIYLVFEVSKQEDLKDCDCLLIIFMTHGWNDMLFARDTYYHPEILRLMFTTNQCKQMAGKPKLFIIQVDYLHLRN